MLLMEKDVGTLQYIGYVPEKCSPRRKRMEDKVEGSNVHRV